MDGTAWGSELGLGLFENPIQRDQGRPIYIVGFDPSSDLLNIPAVRENRDRLKVPDQVIFDRASRPEYGPIETLFDGRAASAGLFTEINNRRIEIAGLYELGTSFGIDGSIVTSDLNFLRIFPDQQPGLVHLAENHDFEFGRVRLPRGVDQRDAEAPDGRQLLAATAAILLLSTPLRIAASDEPPTSFAIRASRHTNPCRPDRPRSPITSYQSRNAPGWTF